MAAALDLSQFRNLDPKQIGDWPVLAKGAVILALCALVLGAGYWFDTMEQLSTLEQKERAESDLKTDFEKKQAKAVNLEVYKQQMEEMKQTFGTLLRQLPGKTEVADLLVDVTQTGLAAGLEFKLFKPQGEQRKDFYAELPIAVQVRGDYHQLGQFVSGVAALPRIVTLHNISIAPEEKGSGLLMDATAKTYRYLDDEEMEEQAKKDKKAAKGGGK